MKKIQVLTKEVHIIIFLNQTNPGLEIIITEWKNSREGVQHQTQTRRRKISKLKEKLFEMIKFKELKEERMKKSG